MLFVPSASAYRRGVQAPDPYPDPDPNADPDPNLDPDPDPNPNPNPNPRCGKFNYDEATKTYTVDNPKCIQGWTKSACGEWTEVLEIKTKVRVRVRVRVRVKGRVRVRGP